MAQKDNLGKPLQQNSSAEQDARWALMAFDRANDAIFVHRRNTRGLSGEFLAVNDAACSRLGYTREELLSLSPQNIAIPAVVAKYPRIKEKSAEKGNIVFESVQLAKDGSTIPVENSAYLFDIDEDTFTITISRDITERKKAQHVLEESERWYRMIVDSANDAVFVYGRQPDGDRGNFIEVNQATCDLLGYTREELLKMSPRDLVDSSSVEGNLSAIQTKLFKDKRAVFETVHVAKNGNRIPVEISVNLFEVEGRPITVAISRDITGRKSAEAALGKSYGEMEGRVKERTAELEKERDKAQRYLDLAGVMFVALNTKGEVTLINRKGCEVLGYEEHEILGKNWFENFVPERIKAEILPVSHKLLSGEIETAEYYENPILTKSGQERMIAWHNTVIRDESDRITGHLSSGEDITERKRAEEAYHTLVDNTLQGLLIRQDDRIVFANQALVEMSGYTLEELYNLSPDEIRNLVHPEDQDFVFMRAQERLEGKPVPPQFEFRFVRKDGQVRWVEQYASLIEYNGRPAAQAAYIDITERKRSKEALADSEERFRNIFDQAVDGIGLAAVDSKRFVLVNKKMCDMLGYTNDEFIKLSVSDIHPEKDLPYVFEQFEKQARGEITLAESIPVKRKDGSVFYADFNSTPVKLAGKPHLLGIIHDITERKHAAEELRRKDYIIESASSAIATADLDGKMTYANPTFLDMWGFDNPEEFLGKPFSNYWMIADSYDEIMDELRGKGKWADEVQAKRKDGSIFYVQVSAALVHDREGNPVSLMSSSVDISERRRAAEELRESQDRLQQIADTIDDVFWMTDWTTHKTIFASQAYERVWGRPREELYADAEGWANAIHPDDRQRAWDMFVNLGKGEKYDEEYRVIRPDGAVRWVRDRGFPIFNEQGEVYRVVGVAQDITERKHAEEELRNLSAAVEQSIGGVAMADTDKRITYVNPAYAQMHGYETDEMIGMEIRQLNHNNYIPTANEHVEMIQEQGSAVYQSEHIRKDGTLFMIQEVFSTLWDDSGAEKAYLLIAEDITEKKKMEDELRRYSENLEQIVEERTQELKDSEAWYRMLLSTPSDMVFVYDRNDDGSMGNIIEVNPAATQILGYSREEFLKMKPLDVADPTIGVDYTAIAKKLHKDKHVVFESVRVAKDGRKIPVEVSSNLFTYRGKTISTSIARDISDRKKAAKKLDETQQKLVRAEKLAAIGQLASGIAHELRNPLAVINNAAYFLKMKMGGDDAMVDKHLGIMEREVFRSSGIIAGLLDFARTREPLSEKVDLDKFIEDILSKLSMPKGVNLTYELQLDGLIMSIDIEQIKRVLLNIINNAIQAMPDGGNLTIQTQQSDGFVELEISDTGVGISQKDRRRIFEPLFTTRSDKGGTGIGLSICKSIVEAHHGSIKVKSNVGEGTTFTIKLPANQA